jgi:hypothetical protein
VSVIWWVFLSILLVAVVLIVKKAKRVIDNLSVQSSSQTQQKSEISLPIFFFLFVFFSSCVCVCVCIFRCLSKCESCTTGRCLWVSFFSFYIFIFWYNVLLSLSHFLLLSSKLDIQWLLFLDMWTWVVGLVVKLNMLWCHMLYVCFLSVLFLNLYISYLIKWWNELLFF